jgi:predicted dinucleotide-binding enzyme
MNIGVLGTGVVGRALSGKLAALGHGVMVGTRDVARTLATTEPGRYGNPPFSEWQEGHPAVKLGTFAEAAAFGELLVNATNGAASLPDLEAAGAANLRGKTLIDISNPLDFSRGMPPSLFVCNTDSLAEQIQRAFPELKVVKTLNTVNALVMVDPRQVAGGDHDMLMCGNDPGAKAQVADLLKNEFGWKSVIDLGDLSAARGMEMYLPLWIQLMGTLNTPLFNLKFVK